MMVDFMGYGLFLMKVFQIFFIVFVYLNLFWLIFQVEFEILLTFQFQSFIFYLIFESLVKMIVVGSFYSLAKMIVVSF